MSDFNKCLQIILHHEGGYVNHPEDPGGETNLGVTKRVYAEFNEGKCPKEMKDLEVEDVEPIYRKNYWDRTKCDLIHQGLNLCVFDFAVNAGPGRAAKYLQDMIGTVVDGGIGPKTIDALGKYVDEHGLDNTIEEYQKRRQGYYESLSHFATFGKGWTRRVEETTEEAYKMSIPV